MKIFVTGSAGFINGYVVEELLNAGHEVVGIDNYSKYGPIEKSYDKHPRYHLHFAPISASRPTLVEGWLTLRQSRRGVFPTIEALKAAIRRHIKAANAAPRSFVWTKSADDILDSVRCCRRRTTVATECQATSTSAR